MLSKPSLDMSKIDMFQEQQKTAAYKLSGNHLFCLKSQIVSFFISQYLDAET